MFCSDEVNAVSISICDPLVAGWRCHTVETFLYVITLGPSLAISSTLSLPLIPEMKGLHLLCTHNLLDISSPCLFTVSLLLCTCVLFVGVFVSVFVGIFVDVFVGVFVGEFLC